MCLLMYIKTRTAAAASSSTPVGLGLIPQSEKEQESPAWPGPTVMATGNRKQGSLCASSSDPGCC